MNRSHAIRVLGGMSIVGCTSPLLEGASPKMSRADTQVATLIKAEGNFPNNDSLPLLLYAGAVKLTDRDPAIAFERLFASHGWGGTWRNGIYAFHHYHSEAHEVLGVYSGSATVQFGGPLGLTITIQPGDAVLIPAGVSHKLIRRGDLFAVVGAYPKGQSPDMCYGKKGERPLADQRVSRVPLPEKGPVAGDRDAMLKHWRKGE